MTEAEWLQSPHVNLMLDFLRGEANDRKLRLFACACCRRVWHLLTDDRSREAVTLTERFADGQASAKALTAAKLAARRAARQAGKLAPALTAAWYAARAASPRYAVWDIAWFVAWHAARAVADSTASWNRERQEQAALLREIVGNPFRATNIPRSWPAEVISLAEAHYAGEDGHGQLARALGDLGHAAFADHFQAQGHPRGCWVLDVILGKTINRRPRRRRGIRASRGPAGSR
jgi:hypothetical protein